MTTLTRSGFLVSGIQMLPSGFIVGRVHLTSNHSFIATYDRDGYAIDEPASYDLNKKFSNLALLHKLEIVRNSEPII